MYYAMNERDIYVADESIWDVGEVAWEEILASHAGKQTSIESTSRVVKNTEKITGEFKRITAS